jgi:hemoglobin
MAQSLYEHYGGFATVSRIVMHFYDMVLDSDVLADFFEGVDMRRLIDHQTKFVTSLMGGPASYTDEMLRQIHARLEIDDVAFDEMARTFRSALEDFDMAAEDVEEVVGQITSRRALIVTVK